MGNKPIKEDVSLLRATVNNIGSTLEHYQYYLTADGIRAHYDTWISSNKTIIDEVHTLQMKEKEEEEQKKAKKEAEAKEREGISNGMIIISAIPNQSEVEEEVIHEPKVKKSRKARKNE